MSIETEEFLAHFGVKGMKWGVRRANLRESSAAVDKAKTEKQQAKKNLKAAKAVKRQDQKEMAKSVLGTAAVVTAGAVIAVGIIKASRNKKVKTFIKNDAPKLNQGRADAKLFMKKHGNKTTKRYLTPIAVRPGNTPNAIDAKSKERRR